MKPILRQAALAALVTTLVATSAWAWGPRAQRSISYTALQVVERDFPDTLSVHVRDIVAGAEAGYDELRENHALNSESEVVAAIASEMQLLREVRKYGVSSYFAYRLGVLSALTADAILPFGFAWSPREANLQETIAGDIDAALENFSYTQTDDVNFIRNPRIYFQNRRSFYGEAKRIIARDYERGSGYGGYLANGAPAYFETAINTVADVWYTVLQPVQQINDVAPSPTNVTWYFVGEIRYLLEVKANQRRALQAYDLFERVNPGIATAFEEVGDLFYTYGTDEAQARGVREWRQAYAIGSTNRSRVAKKLAEHHLEEGQRFLDRGQQPGSDDGDLPAALREFEAALTFDRNSDLAAEKIQETNGAITARQERYDLNSNIIASADAVMAEADVALEQEDFALAISTYQRAEGLYETVDDFFPALAEQAEDKIATAQESEREAIDAVFERAEDAIDEGEDFVDQRRYDEAITRFERVSQTLALLPEEMQPQQEAVREDLLNSSREKIEETKEAKTRFEQAQAEQGGA